MLQPRVLKIRTNAGVKLPSPRPPTPKGVALGNTMNNCTAEGNSPGKQHRIVSATVSYFGINTYCTSLQPPGLMQLSLSLSYQQHYVQCVLLASCSAAEGLHVQGEADRGSERPPNMSARAHQFLMYFRSGNRNRGRDSKAGEDAGREAVQAARRTVQCHSAA